MVYKSSMYYEFVKNGKDIEIMIMDKADLIYPVSEFIVDINQMDTCIYKFFFTHSTDRSRWKKIAYIANVRRDVSGR